MGQPYTENVTGPCQDFRFRTNPEFATWHEEAHVKQLEERLKQRLDEILKTKNRSGQYIVKRGVTGKPEEQHFQDAIKKDLDELVEEFAKIDHQEYGFREWVGKFPKGGLEEGARTHACTKWMEKYGDEIVPADRALAAARSALDAARQCDSDKFNVQREAYEKSRDAAITQKSDLLAANGAKLKNDMEKAGLVDFPGYTTLEKLSPKRAKGALEKMVKEMIDDRLKEAEELIKKADEQRRKCSREQGRTGEGVPADVIVVSDQTPRQVVCLKPGVDAEKFVTEKGLRDANILSIPSGAQHGRGSVVSFRASDDEAKAFQETLSQDPRVCFFEPDRCREFLPEAPAGGPGAKPTLPATRPQTAPVGVIVKGHVQDGHGKPLAGAAITLEAQKPTPEDFAKGDDRGWDLGRDAIGPTVVTSGPDGSFGPATVPTDASMVVAAGWETTAVPIDVPKPLVVAQGAKCECKDMKLSANGKAIGPDGDPNAKDVWDPWPSKNVKGFNGEDLGPIITQDYWGYAFEVVCDVEGDPSNCREIQLIKRTLSAERGKKSDGTPFNKTDCEKNGGKWNDQAQKCLFELHKEWRGSFWGKTDLDLDAEPLKNPGGKAEIDVSDETKCKQAGGEWDVNACVLKFPAAGETYPTYAPDESEEGGEGERAAYRIPGTYKKHIKDKDKGRIIWADAPGLGGLEHKDLRDGDKWTAHFIGIVRGTDGLYCACKWTLEGTFPKGMQINGGKKCEDKVTQEKLCTEYLGGKWDNNKSRCVDP